MRGRVGEWCIFRRDFKFENRNEIRQFIDFTMHRSMMVGTVAGSRRVNLDNRINLCDTHGAAGSTKRNVLR